MRLSCLAIALLLTACAFHPQIEGPYAGRVSEEDVAQLNQLIRQNGYQPQRIDAVGADHVKIWAMNYIEKVPTWREWDVVRRNGRWQITNPPPPPPPPGAIVVT